MNLLDRIFPQLVAARQANEAAARRDAIYSKLVERELAELEVSSERPGRMNSPLLESTTTVQNLGNTWWTELSSLTLDQAWKQGFPSLELAYSINAAMVANNDAFRNLTLAVSRALYDQHPHAKTIVDTRVAFVVGQNAWTVEPCPKVASPRAGRIDTVQEAEGDVDPDAIGIVGDGVPPVGELPPPKKAPESAESKPLIDKALQRTLRTAWQKYTRRGVFHPLLGWKQFWREAYLRCERDGEVFIYLANHQEDGRLAPRFLEPEDIQHPLGINTMVSAVFDKDANGISVEAEDQSTVIGYYWLPKAILGAKPVFLPADRVIHHKINTDSGVRRGLSRLFVIRHFLRHFDTWIFQSLKHQKVQSMIAILRQWENAPESVIQNLVNSRKYRERTFTAPTGNSINYRTEEQYPTVDAPMGMKMTMCSPNGNFADSEILARRVLLAVAVGANLSEAMVTGDGSNANYACHDEMTEVLTRRGWMHQDEIQDNDLVATMNPETHNFEYQKPKAIHRHWHEGEMVQINGNHNFDMLVTRNHRLFLTETQHRRINGRMIQEGIKPWHFETIEEAIRRARFILPVSVNGFVGKKPGTFTLPGLKKEKYNPHLKKPRTVPMVEWLRFLGYWVAEGWTVNDGPKHRFMVGLSQKTGEVERSIQATLDALSSSGISFRRIVKSENQIIWQCTDKRLWSWLRQHGGIGSYGKKVPDFIKDLDASLIHEFMKTAIEGDGSIRGFSAVYFTVSGQLADDMADLGVKTGCVVSIKGNMDNGTFPIVLRRGDIPLRVWTQRHCSIVQYRGIVWCPEVANGIVITRRGGKVAITGNSTRITQLIPLRHFEEEQGTWSETVEQFYQKWVQTESALGRIPKVLDDSMLDCNVTPTPLPDFEQELRATPVTTLRQAGIIPLRTAHELLGLDPETQEERMRQETEQLDADTQALRNSMTGGNAAPEAPAAEDDNPVSGKADAEPGQEQGQAFVKTIDRMRGLSGVAPLNGSSYQVPLR